MKRRLAKHGTMTRYYTLKCRCDKCRKYAREYMRNLRARLKTDAGVEIPHGLNGYENYACRCDKCVKAKAKSRRALKKTVAA
jgi:thymidine kinase